MNRSVSRPFAPWIGALLVLALVTTGCGYSLVGRASNLPEDVQKVYVEPLENRTTRSQVEQILTRSIVDELVTRQRFELVNSAGLADAEIRGAVTRYAATPVTFNTQGRATEYEISIVAQVIFQRPQRTAEEKPEVIWRNDQYTFREPYDVPGGATDYFDLEDQAIEDVAERFAETMITDLLEGF